MIEIVCPSCKARYQLPDGSIGPSGRKVSCSSCAHKWRAFPEPTGDLAPAAAPVAPAVPVAPAAPAPSYGGGAAAMQPPPAAADRDAQMDAIRRMLSDLKETADKAPPAMPEPQPDPGRQRRPAVPEPEPAPDERVYNPFEEQTARQSESPRQVRRRGQEGDDVDPLRARIDDVAAHDKAVKGEATAKTNYDAHRLRKKHEKRAKKMQRARERRRSAGGFFTGFVLVVVVAGTMSGLYSFHRQIIAMSPDLEPAMIEYVTVVDQYRVQFADSTKEWRELVMDKIKRFTKKGGDDAGGGAAGTGGTDSGTGSSG